MININEINVGDCFSESPYYKVVKVNKNDITFQHIQSGKEVTLSNNYVGELLTTADQFQKEIEVGVLDKYYTDKQVKEYKGSDTPQVGDLKQKGIRTIFSEIGTQVFTCCFVKKGKELSKTAYEKKIREVLEDSLTIIGQAAIGKKGVAKTAAEVVEDLIRNPITNYEKGEERVLRGFKVQFESNDGFYQVVDLDITSGDNKRLVNLNTLQWLVVGGVKYVVE
jgi:hypothetical protein